MGNVEVKFNKDDVLLDWMNTKIVRTSDGIFKVGDNDTIEKEWKDYKDSHLKKIDPKGKFHARVVAFHVLKGKKDNVTEEKKIIQYDVPEGAVPLSKILDPSISIDAAADLILGKDFPVPDGKTRRDLFIEMLFSGYIGILKGLRLIESKAHSIVRPDNILVSLHKKKGISILKFQLINFKQDTNKSVDPKEFSSLEMNEFLPFEMLFTKEGEILRSISSMFASFVGDERTRSFLESSEIVPKIGDYDFIYKRMLEITDPGLRNSVALDVVPMYSAGVTLSLIALRCKEVLTGKYYRYIMNLAKSMMSSCPGLGQKQETVYSVMEMLLVVLGMIKEFHYVNITGKFYEVSPNCVIDPYMEMISRVIFLSDPLV